MLLALISWPAHPLPAVADESGAHETIQPSGDADTDTANLIAAVSRSNVVKLVDGATYTINSTVAIRNPTVLCGKATVISGTRRELIQVVSADVAIRGITFDGNGKSNYPGMIRVYKGSHRFAFSDGVIQNVHSGKKGVGNLYPLWISVDGVNDWLVRSSRFQDISNHGDGKPIGKGFVGAFRYGDVVNDTNPLTPVTIPSNGRITGCTFRDIFTVTDKLNDIDADAIRASVSMPSDADVDVVLRIEDCAFEDVQKSAVKAAHIGGVVIDNCIVTNRRTDFPMSFGFRTNTTTGFRVHHCEIRGNVLRGVYLGNGGPCIVSDLIFRPNDPVKVGDSQGLVADSAVQLGARNNPARFVKRAVIHDVYVSNARRGIYGANCDWINVSNITLAKGVETVTMPTAAKRIELSNTPSPFEPLADTSPR
ncbi:hypothetical protein Pla52o_56610 [Novipirellula galeiformis]|uniref:Right handed beta helix domain-containing protein n=1 Tax=Novipirellula galeiformis TaxID=2528004 RepID=A0A5C6BGI7_9BACT|nr:right-handed parallel beta-helix repeat-containing protein [Novipirellula galeiformis]TWU10379.1 hypothetical protein Pla52o_56610 [Novipirellula galeiformis]